MNLPELPTKLIYIVLGFVAIIFVANVLLLDYFFVKQRESLLDFQTRITQLADSVGFKPETTFGKQAAPLATKSAVLTPVLSQTCPATCVDLITLTATASSRVSTRELVTGGSFAPLPTPIFRGGEFFVPMGSGSVSQTTDWTNITSAQATFDAGNYGTIKSAYFEVFLRRSTTATGEVHARLYDSSTPSVFFASDLKTTADTTQFLSAPITLTSGTKIYKVQMYSTNGVSYLDQARIRIVTQ